MESKYCKGCEEEKEADLFYKRKAKPVGHYCIECVLKKNRERWVNGYKEKQAQRRKDYAEKNREYFLEYHRNYYNTLTGRAKTMLKTIKQRMDRWGALDKLDFGEEYLIELMSVKKCNKTGIEFAYEKQNRFKCHPFSPSIDRIDSNGYYTKDNVRMVIWQYNLMKGEMTDSELLDVCKRIVEENSE